MTKYEAIADQIQHRYDIGEITLEQANELNDMAYNKYISEMADINDGEITPEEYLEALESVLDDENEGLTPEEYLEALESALDDENDDSDVTEMKLKVYEAYESGEITLEDRDDLLEYLND